MEHEVFFLKIKKTFLECLLDDRDVRLVISERFEAETNEVKLLESFLMDKAKMEKSLSI